MKWYSFALLLVMLHAADSTDACTVFYICRDGQVLGGSNEDWKDPDTRMWFYPGSSGHFGWIKFGFGSGFPQAGMNENGIFWDATANPWQDMPFSEANKEKLSMPLMQKVMEDCGSLTEAIGICNAFYCDDQYRGQYLIGGPGGCSVIVDGDHFHLNEYSYQVLTNFHLSNPDLGGYPCWRYAQASEMLDTCETPTPVLIGSVLSATQQSGSYPTQYSIIFDPRQGMLYLFYYQNFQEYLSLKLDECLSGDTVSYAIPPLFSRMELLYPAQGADIGTDSVTLKWKGLQGSSYRVQLTDNNGDIAWQSSTGTTVRHPANRSLYYVLLLMPFLPVFVKRKSIMLAMLASVFILCHACKKDNEGSETDPNIVVFTQQAVGLEAGKTYQWKVIATPGTSSFFQTESVSRSFIYNGT